MQLFFRQNYRDALISLCAALFISLCMADDWRKHRMVHLAYVIGGVVIVASWPLRIIVGRRDGYFPIGEATARIGHVMFG